MNIKERHLCVNGNIYAACRGVFEKLKTVEWKPERHLWFIQLNEEKLFKDTDFWRRYRVWYNGYFFIESSNHIVESGSTHHHMRLEWFQRWSLADHGCSFSAKLHCVSQRPRCFRIFLMIWGISIKAIMRISPWHLGQISGSTSYIFCISRAQFFRNFLGDNSGWLPAGIALPLSAFLRIPRHLSTSSAYPP